MYKTNANNYKHDWCIKGFGTQGSQNKDLTSVEQICEKKLENRKTHTELSYCLNRARNFPGSTL